MTAFDFLPPTTVLVLIRSILLDFEPAWGFDSNALQRAFRQKRNLLFDVSPHKTATPDLALIPIESQISQELRSATIGGGRASHRRQSNFPGSHECRNNARAANRGCW